MKINMRGQQIKQRSFSDKIRRIYSLLFPAHIKCIICSRDLPKKQEIEFCSKCFEKLEKIEKDKSCIICGGALKSSNICLNCKRHKREFDMAQSVFVYKDEAQKLIINFKYNNKPYISRTLGKVLADKLKETDWKIDLVIPVPLTLKKHKSRGYNQSELLAKECVKKIGLPLFTDVLHKTKETEQQAKLSFQERQKNLRKTFTVTDLDSIRDKNILLIDDVLTTGATANACALCLKDSGAKKVYLLCIASTRPEILTTTTKKDK